MVAQQRDQRRWRGDGADVAVGTVFELACLAWAGVGPGGGDLGVAAAEVQLAPAVAVGVVVVGQVEVVDGQGVGLGGAQRGVVHAAEEGDQAPSAGGEGQPLRVAFSGLGEVADGRQEGAGLGGGDDGPGVEAGVDLGGRHLIRSSGLAGKWSCSTASSSTL